MTKDEAQAMDVADKAIINKAIISAIIATDAAESERSVHIVLDQRESAVIFKAIIDLMKARK